MEGEGGGRPRRAHKGEESYKDSKSNSAPLPSYKGGKGKGEGDGEKTEADCEEKECNRF